MRILILEDDPLTALDLQCLLDGCGHEIVGLCGTVADAGEQLSDDVDFAFLDIDLPDGKSFPFAETLKRRCVPFAFVSASRRSELPAALRHVPFIAKPYQHAAIKGSLASARMCAAA